MKKTTALSTLFVLMGSCAAWADQGIAISAKPFDQPLPIAPAAAPAAPAAPVAQVVAAAPEQAAPRYEVTASDKTIREVLARWAKASGWVHDPVHWTIDRDFPVAATAGPEVFGTEFKKAVQILLSSTELTDRPVQPCFYTNHVVRVIPKAELCDRTVTTQ